VYIEAKIERHKLLEILHRAAQAKAELCQTLRELSGTLDALRCTPGGGK